MTPDPPDTPAPPPSPLWTLGLGIGGFLVGVGLLRLGAGRTDRSAAFVTSSGFAVWASIIGAQTAYWVTAAGPLWHDLGRVWRHGTRRRAATAALAVALVVILVVFPFFSAAATIPWPLWGHQAKVRVLTLTAGLAVGVPALSGIALIQQTVQGRRLDDVDERDVAAALQARTDLQRFLSVAGAIIGLAVLASGALRRAVVPTFVAADAFPQEGILLYGAFFTGLLTLVYVPAHLTLKRLGVEIRDHYFPPGRMPEPTADAFTSWVDKRAALENLSNCTSHQLSNSKPACSSSRRCCPPSSPPPCRRSPDPDQCDATATARFTSRPRPSATARTNAGPGEEHELV